MGLESDFIKEIFETVAEKTRHPKKLRKPHIIVAGFEENSGHAYACISGLDYDILTTAGNIVDVIIVGGATFYFAGTLTRDGLQIPSNIEDGSVISFKRADVTNRNDQTPAAILFDNGSLYASALFSRYSLDCFIHDLGAQILSDPPAFQNLQTLQI